MTNSKTYQDYWFVAKGDQPLPITGNIITNGIADGQLGVIAADSSGSLNSGDFVDSADTAATVPAIKIVQGTPASADYSNNVGWFNEDKAYVSSPIIRNGEIRSFSAQYAPVQAYSSYLAASFSAPTADHEYSIYTTLDSIRKDRDYGRNQHRIPPAYYKAVTGDGVDDLLVNIAHKYNRFSKLITNKPRHSTHEIVCLGIDISGGGAGTVIGDIAVGDSVDFMTLNGVTYSFIANEAFLQTFYNTIANTTVTATSTIEVIDPTSVAPVDALLFVGLDEDLSVGTDLIYDSKANIRALEFGRDFQTDMNVAVTEASTKQNALNSSRVLKIRWEESGSTLQGTMQLAGFSDTLILPPNYIADGTEYTVFTLTAERKIDTLTIEPNFKFRINILVPGAKTIVDAKTAITVATNDTGTTSDAINNDGLEQVLGTWLKSANTHQLLGTATASTYFA